MAMQNGAMMFLLFGLLFALFVALASSAPEAVTNTEQQQQYSRYPEIGKSIVNLYNSDDERTRIGPDSLEASQQLRSEEEKRATRWNQLQGGWGKRADNWNKLSGVWGKRVPSLGELDNLDEELTKRNSKWNNLNGMWGKRGWNDLSGGWGKRGAPHWNNLRGMWGKRGKPIEATSA